MNDAIGKVIKRLEDSGGLLMKMEVTVGFDGFVDNIVRVVKNRKHDGDIVFFKGLEEFSEYIISKKDMSHTIELCEQVVKPGGNMPILAIALRQFGLNVNCIGAMGYPEIKPVFSDLMLSGCKLCSIADPGYTTALEFNDGKIMFAQMRSVNDITWNDIKTKVGLETLKQFFQRSAFIGMVNWSEVENSSDIWERIICDVLPYHTPDKRQILCFDLSDISRRCSGDIQHAMDLIGKFREHFKVILGMNENETLLLHNVLNEGRTCNNPEECGDSIFSKLNIDLLVIHAKKAAFAFDAEGKHVCENLYIESPKFSTGGGDNFNAGLCIAQLLGMDTESTLVLANAASGFYVKYGRSSDTGQLLNYLREWANLISESKNT